MSISDGQDYEPAIATQADVDELAEILLRGLANAERESASAAPPPAKRPRVTRAKRSKVTA